MKTTTIKDTDALLALRDKDGVIRGDENLRIECDVPYSAGKQIAGIVVGGYLYCSGDRLIVMGDLFWSHASMPKLPDQSYIRRVLPPGWQRDHWQVRLGMDISEGCYEDICKVVMKQIVNLLRDERWTTTERWMLETLRDSEKEPPKWVAEAIEEKKEVA